MLAKSYPTANLPFIAISPVILIISLQRDPLYVYRELCVQGGKGILIVSGSISRLSRQTKECRIANNYSFKNSF